MVATSAVLQQIDRSLPRGAGEQAEIVPSLMEIVSVTRPVRAPLEPDPGHAGEGTELEPFPSPHVPSSMSCALGVAVRSVP